MKLSKKIAIGVTAILGYIGAGYISDTIHRQSKLLAARSACFTLKMPLLNISCGKTAFGDVNADIIPQDVPNFVLYDPNKPLPFRTLQFGAVYSSHTLEHSEDPLRLLAEFDRVSHFTFIALPDIWFLPVLDRSHVWLPLDQSGKRWVRNPFYDPEYAQKKNPTFGGNPLIF